jgi:geranylgeranyl reductase family protein
MTKQKIAVVGAGPAGGYFASRLARNGFLVDIFDPSHPREKPCGGVLSAESLEYVPEARDLKSANPLKTLAFQTPFGRRFKVTHPRESIAVDRKEFDGYLLNRAIEAGGHHLAERVMGVEFLVNEVLIHTKNATRSYDLVCGADGVRSIVAQAVDMSLASRELGFTMGGWGPTRGTKSEVLIRFGNHIGYSWVINRKDCASIGVGGPFLQKDRIIRAFSEFCEEQSISTETLTPYKWVIPFSASPSYLQRPRSGPRWLLVGDAAGFCDPLTGEGIHLALASAHSASQAIMNGTPEVYESSWRATLGPNMIFGAQNRHLLASRPFTESLLNMLKRNPEMGLSFFKLL